MSDAPAPFDRLTARELHVVRRIVDGDRNAQIAAALQCSVKTVDTHRANALKKLNLRHNVDLTREAIRVGLVTIVDVDKQIVGDAVRALLDAIAIPQGRDAARAWEDICLMFGRYTSPWIGVTPIAIPSAVPA